MNSARCANSISSTISPLRWPRCVFSPSRFKERAKNLFFTLGREFDSWRDIEDAFLRKYYSVSKTSAVRKAIRELSQEPGEVFYKA